MFAWSIVFPNVTCFLFVRSCVAVLLNAVQIPYVVFCARWVMLAVGFVLFCSWALSMVFCRESVLLTFAIAVRSSSAVVMLSSRKRSSCCASRCNICLRCLRRFNFRYCFSFSLSDLSENVYIRLLGGVASGVVAIVGVASGVVAIVVLVFLGP